MENDCQSISVRILSSNRLAALFLYHILAEKHVTEIGLGSRQSSSAVPVLFVIDGTHLGIPITEYVKRLVNGYPNSLFIVIDSNERAIRLPFMLSLGIHGFLLQDQIETSLLRAVEFVMAGQVWAPHQAVRACSVRRDCATERANALTHREIEVLELVQRRLSNKEVANALRIQESTVKYHVANLFRKLCVTSRKGLTALNGGIQSPLML